jgi:hypothetical protein
MGLWMRIREHPRKPGMKIVFIDTEGETPWLANTVCLRVLLLPLLLLCEGVAG